MYSEFTLSNITFIFHKQIWSKIPFTWNIFWYSVSFLRSSSWSIKSFILSQVWGSVSLRSKSRSGVMQPYSGAINLVLPSGLKKLKSRITYFYLETLIIVFIIICSTKIFFLHFSIKLNCKFESSWSRFWKNFAFSFRMLTYI